MLTFQMKKAIVDQRRVKDAFDRQTKGSISRSLAFVRRRGRSTLRRRKRASRPGQAPSVHSTHPFVTLKNIVFNYDRRTKSGIVGPIKLNGTKSTTTARRALPGILEAGGTVVIHEESYDGKVWWQQRRTRRPSNKKKTRKRSVRIAARPTMGPALKIEEQKGNILSPWANVITG